jgi:hypothetical protein
MPDDKKKPKVNSKFDPTKEDFAEVRKITPITQEDGSVKYKYFYDKVPEDDGYDEDMNSHTYTSGEHKDKQNKSHPQYSEKAVRYLTKTRGLYNRDVANKDNNKVKIVK